MPIKSVEKYLLAKMIYSPDITFIKQIGNKYFTLDSLDSILKLAKKDYKITADRTGKKLMEHLCEYLAKVRLSQEDFVRSLCEDIFAYENFERLKGNIEKFIEDNFAVTSK